MNLFSLFYIFHDVISIQTFDRLDNLTRTSKQGESWGRYVALNIFGQSFERAFSAEKRRPL